MKQKLLLMLLFAFYCANNYAQKAGTSTGVQAGIPHINDYLNSQSPGGAQMRTSGISLDSLLKDNHPSVYVAGSDVDVIGNNPICFFTDVTSLASLGSANAAYDSGIQMVVIKITSEQDLSTGIDLAVLSRFSNLKYVYILSEATVNVQQLKNSVQNRTSGYNVFYNIVKPS